MARKRGGSKKKSRSSVGIMEYVIPGRVKILNILGTTAFFFFGIAIMFAAVDNPYAAMTLGGVLLFVWAAVLLPLDDLHDRLEWMLSDDFGHDMADRLDDILPWRDKRGQSSVAVVAVAALFVLSTVAGVTVLAAGGAVATSGSSTATTAASCSTNVSHDWFRTSEAVREANQTGAATNTEMNTRVTINQTSMFYRVTAENLNGYCTHLTVEVNSSLIPPTELGRIDSVNEKSTGTWRDVTNFKNKTTYTEIEFTVPANETVVFAPSRPTVFVPAWRDEQTRQVGGWFGVTFNYTSPFGGDKLEKKTYTFSGENRSEVTIKLVNETTGDRIKEWTAQFRTSKSQPWAPVGQKTSEPAYYEYVDGGDKVKFVLSKDAQLKFTANPGLGKSLESDFRSLFRSAWELRHFKFLSLAPPAPNPVMHL